MNVKLRKNLEELSFLLQYFNQRLDHFKAEGMLKPGFENFIKECTKLTGKLTASIQENDMLEKELEQKSVPIVEPLQCNSCNAKKDTLKVSGSYHHPWGWECNTYTCSNCGAVSQGFQPNNLEDLISFPEQCRSKLNSSDADALSKEEKASVLNMVDSINSAVERFRSLNSLLLKSLDRKKEVEADLESRIASYCSILLVEKYRLETGNESLGSC